MRCIFPGEYPNQIDTSPRWGVVSNIKNPVQNAQDYHSVESPPADLQNLGNFLCHLDGQFPLTFFIAAYARTGNADEFSQVADSEFSFSPELCEITRMIQ